MPERVNKQIGGGQHFQCSQCARRQTPHQRHHRIIKWLEGNLKIFPSTPLPWAAIPFHYPRLLKALESNLALDTSRDPASPGILCLSILTRKNFILKSHLILPSFSLKPFALVLWQGGCLPSPAPHPLQEEPCIRLLRKCFQLIEKVGHVLAKCSWL